MSARLKIGIVGLGAVARVHMRAYEEVSTAKVTCVADNSEAQLALARRQFNLPAYSSLQEMLRSEALDIVCVTTPPSSHEALVSLCAAAGVNVLCEKPMSLSVGSCERMIEVCRSNGVRLSYGASYRYLPAMVTARDLIRSGALGDILLLREYAVGGVTTAQRATLPPSHYPSGGPGGSGMGLCDHGIHLVDAFPWLMNSTTIAASGRGNITGEQQRPEFAQLQYANGAMGQLLYEDGTFTTTLPNEGTFAWSGGWTVGDDGAGASGSWHPDPGCIHVHGTVGSLRIFYYANTLFLRDKTGVRQVKTFDRPMPGNFAMQLEAFVEAIRTGAPTPVPGEAGLDAIRTLAKIYGQHADLGWPQHPGSFRGSDLPTK